MNRSTITLAAIVAVAAVCSGAPVETGIKGSDVLDVMNKVNNYYIANQIVKSNSCGWERGTYYEGLMAHYLLGKNASYFSMAMDWGETYKWETCNYPSTLNEQSAANDYLNSQTFAQVYALTGKQNSTYIDISCKEMKIIVDRPQVDDYWWIDAFNMGLPTFAALYNVTGDVSYIQKMYQLFNNTCVNRTLWDTTEDLFYRDQTYIGQKTPHGEKVFWARGNSWAISGLTRVVQWITEAGLYANVYIDHLQKLAAKLATLQGSDGMWRSSLLDPLQFTNPETTGTAGFTFGIAAGINMGYLDRQTFLPVVQNAWKGMASIAVQESGLLGYCQPVGAGPAPANATDTNDFCVGLFLLAGSEVARL